MSKLSLAICGVAFGAWTAFADTEPFLYWMIDTTDTGLSDLAGPELKGYDTVKISYRDNEGQSLGYLTQIYYTNGKPLSIDREGVMAAGTVNSFSSGGVGFYASLAGSYGNAKSFSYVIELWNGSDWVGQSADLYVADAQPYISLADSSGIRAAMQSTPWMAGNFTAAPEPNSAVLTLIGLAVLGLRRRKAAKA